MGKKQKQLIYVEDYSSAEEEERKRKSIIVALSSDDDAEADEDLTLKIVEKSMKNDVNRDPRSDGVSKIVIDLTEERKKVKKKRRKSNEVEVPQDLVLGDIRMGSTYFSGEVLMLENLVDKEKPHEDTNATISVKDVETNPDEVSDNVVMRKLLRGPRYFDPPDNSWGSCFNCGEEGHTAIKCPSGKRRKPCFVCGSFEHNAKQCTKGRDCFICKQKGHRAKDCPVKNTSSRICLKCGDSGHDMFSCRNDYSSADLKEIQCYICGKFGHLCCVDYGDPVPRQASCYRCGLSGHTGLACASHSNNGTSMASSSCYTCGLQGHFARECTNSTKARIRNHEPSTPSTPKLRSSKNKKKQDPAVKSAPAALWEKHKKKKALNGERTSASKPRDGGRWMTEDPGKTKTKFTSSVQMKYRGGWMTEDPGDSYINKITANNWRFMESPSERRSNIFSHHGDYASSSHSPRMHYNLDYYDSTPDGSSRFFQHGYTATRFARNDNYGTRLNYDRW